MLVKISGATKYLFKKDFISQVMKQALQAKKQKGFKFVAPAIAFSDVQVYGGMQLNKVQQESRIQKF